MLNNDTMKRYNFHRLIHILLVNDKYTMKIKFLLKNTLAFCCLCLLLTGCDEEKEVSSLSKIIHNKEVNVGTLLNHNSYYIGNDGPAGFEYELAKKYADSLGVSLNIIPSYHLEELLPKLETGEVDIIAAGLLVTPNRLNNYKFAPSYNEVSQKIVYKQGNKRPRKFSDLTGKLIVTSHSSYAEKLQQLKLEHPNLTWHETSDFDSEELLKKVLDGEYDYTVIDSNSLALNRRYYPDISVAFTIQQAEPIAWALSQSSDDSLLASLIEFFGDTHNDGTIITLTDKYYGHIERFDYVDTRTFIRAIESKLPKYQPWFKKYSDDFDWRLLAAISYQESHWNPKARSYTGVRGMMMLTLPTAKQMGVKNRTDPEQSIYGGAKYIKQLIDRMPKRIANPDRIWFALASYNIGFGHLNDARIITQKQGGDPDRWVDVKNRLPLLKQKQHYKQTKYGYARGNEAVTYVENIRRYHDTLTWFDANNHDSSEAIEQSTDIDNNALNNSEKL